MENYPNPPNHQPTNNTHIPIIDCSSDNNSDECTLQCGESNTSTSALTGAAGEQTPCLIDEDVILNGSILESSAIAIVGAINVTGDVKIIGKITVKLEASAELHVGRCLLLDDESTIVVVVRGDEMITNGSVVLSYDGLCSSPHLIDQVSIESSLVDECRDGKPTLREQLGSGGRTHLELVFLSADSDECNSGMSNSELNVVAIAVAVPVGVLLIVLAVILLVPSVRKKVLPGTLWRGFKR